MNNNELIHTKLDLIILGLNYIGGHSFKCRTDCTKCTQLSKDIIILRDKLNKHMASD